MDASRKKGEVGRSLPRVDADDKLRGRTRFLADLRVEGMLHACQVTSPVPHARLLAVDGSRATGVDGVRAMLTAADVPGENRVGVIVDDQPLFADSRLRFVGDVAAIVAAETLEGARAAAEAVELGFKPLPALLDLDSAQDAPPDALHENGPFAASHSISRGEIGAGLQGCDEIVEGTFRTGAQEHWYLETQGCLAIPESDGLTIYGSIQCPFYVQKAVARCSGLPLGRVRVIQSPTGGAFGGKEDVPNELCARTALLALATDRPVRLLLERGEDIQTTSKRHPFRIFGRLGATRDGRLRAIELEQDAEAGAYATLSPPVIYRACVQGTGPYDIEHVSVKTRAWYTNQPPSGAFRGFGSPQAVVGHEGLIDMMADRLGIDPLEIRRKNLIREGGSTATGHRLFESVGAVETLERVKSGIDGEGGLSALPEGGEDRWLRGVGYATMIYGNCLGKAGWHLDAAGAYLQLHQDGSLSCATGLTEIGQGSRTVVTQMAADAMGLDPEQVSLLPVDSALVPDSGPTVASRNVVMSGNAILDAARQLRSRLSPLAAELLGCRGWDVHYEGGQVRSAVRSLPMAELAAEAWRRNLNLAAEGWWHVPDLDYNMREGSGEAYFAYSFATQAVEVAVDRLSGQVRPLRVWAAHDLGHAVNPAGARAQVEGGVAQGIGWALGERYVSREGKVVSRRLGDYTLPTSVDVPDVKTWLVETPHPDGPFGAKSLGEPAIIPTGAAVLAAVSRAIGRQLTEIPLDPERVLSAMEESGLAFDPLS